MGDNNGILSAWMHTLQAHIVRLEVQAYFAIVYEDERRSHNQTHEVEDWGLQEHQRVRREPEVVFENQRIRMEHD